MSCAVLVVHARTHAPVLTRRHAAGEAQPQSSWQRTGGTTASSESAFHKASDQASGQLHEKAEHAKGLGSGNNCMPLHTQRRVAESGPLPAQLVEIVAEGESGDKQANQHNPHHGTADVQLMLDPAPSMEELASQELETSIQVSHHPHFQCSVLPSPTATPVQHIGLQQGPIIMALPLCPCC